MAEKRKCCERENILIPEYKGRLMKIKTILINGTVKINQQILVHGDYSNIHKQTYKDQWLWLL